MAIEVRTARDDERQALHRLSQQAFAARPAPYDEAGDRAATPLDRRLVASEDGRIVGKLAVWKLGQWFGGRRVPMGGVAGVAVEPFARGRGVASALIRHALVAMRERGEVISTLYPMNHTLYRRHGWEVAGAYPESRVDLAALHALPSPKLRSTIRPAEEADLPALRRLHEQVWRDEPGSLWHGAEFARRCMAAHDGVQDVYVAERADEIVGFVTVTRGDAPDDRGFYALAVRTYAALDLDAELELFRLLLSYHPVAEVVNVVLHQAAATPMFLSERVLRPTGLGWCWMTRLVDAPGAIAARGYAEDVDIEVHLDIEDTSAPWNTGAHVLRIKDGQGCLEPGGRGQVRLGIGPLAALYTGWANPRRLRRLGLVTGAEEGDLAALDRAFGGRTPWAQEFF